MNKFVPILNFGTSSFFSLTITISFLNHQQYLLLSNHASLFYMAFPPVLLIPNLSHSPQSFHTFFHYVHLPIFLFSEVPTPFISHSSFSYVHFLSPQFSHTTPTVFTSTPYPPFTLSLLYFIIPTPS